MCGQNVEFLKLRASGTYCMYRMHWKVPLPTINAPCFGFRNITPFTLPALHTAHPLHCPFFILPTLYIAHPLYCPIFTLPILYTTRPSHPTLYIAYPLYCPPFTLPILYIAHSLHCPSFTLPALHTAHSLFTLPTLHTAYSRHYPPFTLPTLDTAHPSHCLPSTLPTLHTAYPRHYPPFTLPTLDTTRPRLHECVLVPEYLKPPHFASYIHFSLQFSFRRGVDALRAMPPQHNVTQCTTGPAYWGHSPPTIWNLTSSVPQHTLEQLIVEQECADAALTYPVVGCSGHWGQQKYVVLLKRNTVSSDGWHGLWEGLAVALRNACSTVNKYRASLLWSPANRSC